jgi:hypothetical protein
MDGLGMSPNLAAAQLHEPLTRVVFKQRGIADIAETHLNLLLPRNLLDLGQ